MVTTAALALLVIVLVVAVYTRLWVALATAVAAMLVFNFFFLDPIGTFSIRDPQNWAAFLAFVSAALITSQLSSAAQQRAREALESRNELARLFDLSRDILLMGETAATLDALARHIAERFAVERVALHLRRSGEWQVHQGTGAPIVISQDALDTALMVAGSARAGLAATADETGRSCALAVMKLGGSAIGLLAAPAGAVNSATLDAIAGLASMAVERDQFLAERKAADLVRQQADFTSTLLASLSHDLRTPLTAIQVAVTNLDDPALGQGERREQTRLARMELDRLSRLFQGILEMARIDSAALVPEREWITASDIVDATLANLRPLIDDRPLIIDADEGTMVHVDPRLTSAALLHLVENAVQYSPTDSPIELRGWVEEDGIHLSVTDCGPGIDPAESDRMFDRFFRGRRQRERSGGTGMGLAITRGLLAAEQGRVTAENMEPAGARFTIVVPAERRAVMSEI